MSRGNRFICAMCISATTLFCANAAYGQGDFQLRARQLPGWDARAREGRCEIRVWVDNRAEVRMRGEAIFVRTLEGSKGRDEGSECSQPLPYNGVSGFAIRQTAGRNRVTLAQEPTRMNNYTAMIAIVDRQGGGDNYAFEVNWHADAAVATAPAPFFDDVRACQDAVRQSFQKQNGRGSYIDFDAFAERLEDKESRGGSQGRDRGQESIRGKGSARKPAESRDLTYTCVVDMRKDNVLSATYGYSGAALRTNGRPGNRSQLK